MISLGNWTAIKREIFPTSVNFECSKIIECNIGVGETREIKFKVGGKNDNEKREIKFELNNSNISLSTTSWSAENEWILKSKITGRAIGDTTITVKVEDKPINTIKIKCINYKDVFSEDDTEKFIDENKNSLKNHTECFIAVDKQFSKVVNDNDLVLKSYSNLTAYNRIRSYETKFYIQSSKRFGQSEIWIRDNYDGYKLKPKSFKSGYEKAISSYINTGLKNKIGYHIYYFALLDAYHVLTILVDNTKCESEYKILDQLQNRDWKKIKEIDDDLLQMTIRNYDGACETIKSDNHNSSLQLWKLKRK